MNKRKYNADISAEMIIHRNGNGVIIRPPIAGDENKLIIRDLMALPLNVYFLNKNSENVMINAITIETCGWKSSTWARGKSIESIWPTELAELCLENDQGVLRSNKLNVFEEDVFNEKNFGLQALSFKYPWYDADNKIVGIFGCSIVPDSFPFYSLGNSLAVLAKTELLNAPQLETTGITLPTRNSYFTKRELDVLKLIIRAKTSKEIASQLGLSHRTVEHYVENAKRKIGASSKSELIDKIIDAL
jgi:DNA-binding CsgD family transcriptional regulator